MLKSSEAVTTLEIQGARTYFVILFSGEMVKFTVIHILTIRPVIKKFQLGLAMLYVFGSTEQPFLRMIMCIEYSCHKGRPVYVFKLNLSVTIHTMISCDISYEIFQKGSFQMRRLKSTLL